MKIVVRYFASMRDAAGREAETIDTAATDPDALYHELCGRHGFDFPADRLRVAVNGAFADRRTALADGDEVVFLPPVSGG